MADVNLAWEFPTTRKSGKPLALSDIKLTELQISADEGTNYVGLTSVNAPAKTHTVTELEPGKWFFRGRPVDTQNRAAESWLTGSVEIMDQTPPGQLASFTVTLA